jgi:hypothetical protein
MNDEVRYREDAIQAQVPVSQLLGLDLHVCDLLHSQIKRPNARLSRGGMSPAR